VALPPVGLAASAVSNPYQDADPAVSQAIQYFAMKVMTAALNSAGWTRDIPCDDLVMTARSARRRHGRSRSRPRSTAVYRAMTVLAEKLLFAWIAAGAACP
jgi:hypothetical protein